MGKRERVYMYVCVFFPDTLNWGSCIWPCMQTCVFQKIFSLYIQQYCIGFFEKYETARFKDCICINEIPTFTMIYSWCCKHKNYFMHPHTQCIMATIKANWARCSTWHWVGERIGFLEAIFLPTWSSGTHKPINFQLVWLTYSSTANWRLLEIQPQHFHEYLTE